MQVPRADESSCLQRLEHDPGVCRAVHFGLVDALLLHNYIWIGPWLGRAICSVRFP